jgi:hypothetical protein
MQAHHIIGGIIAAIAVAALAYVITNRGPKPPSAPRLGMAAVLVMALALAGCARATDAIVVGLNVSQKVLVDANAILAEQHRRERDEAVASAATPAAAQDAAKAVHARQKPRWDWYEKIRSAWIAAAALARAAQLVEASGGKPNVEQARVAALEVAAALEGFAATVAPGALPMKPLEKP